MSVLRVEYDSKNKYGNRIMIFNTTPDLHFTKCAKFVVVVRSPFFSLKSMQ